MNNSLLQEVMNLLIEIKLTFQKMSCQPKTQLLNNIDSCISKIAPLVDLMMSTPKSGLVERSQSWDDNFSYSSRFSASEGMSEQTPIDDFNHRLSLDEVCQSFTKKAKSQIFVQEAQSQSILLDYFVLKFDLVLDQYISLGREGGQKSDRAVFLDLFSYDKKKGNILKLQKTQSMTNILKQIFSQNKISEPFILPNCQEKLTKYLFVFGLQDCGSLQKEIYRTETMICFVSREFILGQLSQLMNTISKVCFEQRVSQISLADEQELPQVLSLLHTKKTYSAIQRILQDFYKNYDYASKSQDLSVSRLSFWQINSLDRYLDQSSQHWTIVKKSKSKEQKLLPTLVLLFYFVISQQKIAFLALSQKKHAISQLMIGLLQSIQPLTYIYPIVTGTITAHHMEFASSPVPILMGFWGNQENYSSAKHFLKKILKNQKAMNAQQLKNETLITIIDLEDSSLMFLEHNFKETCFTTEKIMAYLDSQQSQLNFVQKLSRLMSRLLSKKVEGEPEWIGNLRIKVQLTQMYEYYTNQDRND